MKEEVRSKYETVMKELRSNIDAWQRDVRLEMVRRG